MKIPVTTGFAAAKGLAAILFSRRHGKRATGFRRFRCFYREAAVILLNTGILLLAVNRWFGLGRNDDPAREWAETDRDREACGDEAVLVGVINLYVENKKMVETIAAAYRVKTLFVWQPVAAYKYDQRHNLFAGEEHPRRACVEGVYPLMSKSVGRHPLGTIFSGPLIFKRAWLSHSTSILCTTRGKCLSCLRGVF
jgi:hypothetical protein